MSVPAPPSIDDFRAAISDGVVAAAGIDDVGAAAAVDRVVAVAAGDDVCDRRAGERDRARYVRCRHVLEIADGDGIAGGLVRVGEVDGNVVQQDQRIGAEFHR